MSETHEAKIIHGTMNVSNLASNSIVFKDGSSMTDVDNQLDANSTNPLSGSAIASALGGLASPNVDTFIFHGIMNPSASHDSTGVITFPTLLNVTSTFGGVTASSPATTITIPVSGTYNIYYKTTAYNSNQIVSTNIRVNGTQLHPSAFSGKGVLTHTTNNCLLQANDIVTLFSNSDVSARSELYISFFA